LAKLKRGYSKRGAEEMTEYSVLNSQRRGITEKGSGLLSKRIAYLEGGVRK